MYVYLLLEIRSKLTTADRMAYKFLRVFRNAIWYLLKASKDNAHNKLCHGEYNQSNIAGQSLSADIIYADIFTLNFTLSCTSKTDTRVYYRDQK
jgi:hypothetical protein